MTTLGGEKVKLAKGRENKAEAEKAFHTLLAHGSVDQADDNGPRPSLRRLAGLFLDEAKETKAPETYDVQRRYLTGFCEYAGKGRKAPDVRVHHVKDWLKAHPNWGESTRALAVTVLIACFNWAVAEQRLDRNPIKGMKRGRYKRRERIIPPEHLTKILALVTPELRDFLTVLSQTGARPISEVGRLEAPMVDFGSGTVTFDKHKNQKKGKGRTVYLTPGATAVLRKLALARPEGPLFLSGAGNPWIRQTCNAQIQRACRKAGVPVYSSYDVRHSWATHALANGLTSDIVAELMGNTPAVVAKYYSHLNQKAEALKEAARRAVS
jgi:integrase